MSMSDETSDDEIEESTEEFALLSFEEAFVLVSIISTCWLLYEYYLPSI